MPKNGDVTVRVVIYSDRGPDLVLSLEQAVELYRQLGASLRWLSKSTTKGTHDGTNDQRQQRAHG